MAELVDALDSKSSNGNIVTVRVPDLQRCGSSEGSPDLKRSSGENLALKHFSGEVVWRYKLIFKKIDQSYYN